MGQKGRAEREIRNTLCMGIRHTASHLYEKNDMENCYVYLECRIYILYLQSKQRLRSPRKLFHPCSICVRYERIEVTKRATQLHPDQKSARKQFFSILKTSF